jgi:hypothetical protein
MANFPGSIYMPPGVYDAPFPCKRCRTTHMSMAVCEGWTKNIVKHWELPLFLEKALGHPAEWTEMVVEESRRLASLRFASAGQAWSGKTGDPIRLWNEPIPWEISGGGYVEHWEVWIRVIPK